MRHVLTRQQLYDMIWERAVSKVAPELGISDVALRKQCVKHAIPLPDATYWGRLHAGRPIKRKPLGVAPKGVSDRIVIDARAKPPAPEPIEAAIAVARQSAEAVAVPERLHPLVAKTLAAARKAEPDRNGAITGLGGEVFRIRAHPDTLDRASAFLNALVYNALARGHRFEAGREGLEMVVDDEAIGFSVYQTIRRSLHVATEEETRRRDRWDARHRNDWDDWDKRPSIPYYDFTPTGEMAIEIAGWSRYESAQRRFADTRARKIDSRIDEILVSFAAFAAGRKVEREEAGERARLEEVARQRRAEQARLAKLEQQRVEYLDRKLAQAQERDRLRTFLATLPADEISEEASAIHAFIGWAGAHHRVSIVVILIRHHQDAHAAWLLGHVYPPVVGGFLMEARPCPFACAPAPANADGTFCRDLSWGIRAGMARKEPIVVNRWLAEAGGNSSTISAV